MAFESDTDEEDEGYFSEVIADFDETGKEPRFFNIPLSSMTSVDLQAMKVDELVKTYRDARDQLGTDRKAYKQREAKVKIQLGVISMMLKDKGDMLGVDTFSTPSGTAYRNRKERFQINSWDDLTGYVEKTGNFQIFQKRVSPNAVKEIRAEEGLPPGLEAFEEEEFSVRSPTARKSR